MDGFVEEGNVVLLLLIGCGLLGFIVGSTVVVNRTAVDSPSFITDVNASLFMINSLVTDSCSTEDTLCRSDIAEIVLIGTEIWSIMGIINGKIVPERSKIHQVQGEKLLTSTLSGCTVERL